MNPSRHVSLLPGNEGVAVVVVGVRSPRSTEMIIRAPTINGKS